MLGHELARCVPSLNGSLARKLRRLRGGAVDPNVALIVGALAAGVAATATQAVKDAYAALKGVLAKRFAGNAKAERALADHAEEPDIYDKAIAKQIEATGAATDAEVLAAAERVKQSAVAAG